MGWIIFLKIPNSLIENYFAYYYYYFFLEKVICHGFNYIEMYFNLLKIRLR